MINSYISSYLDELLIYNENYKHKSEKNIKKGRCGLEFYFMIERNKFLSINKWSKRWDVSTSTASLWIKEFKEIYNKSYRL